MLVAGFFDREGHPCLNIRLGGTRRVSSLTGIIDTGFTGLILLPERWADRIGCEFLTTATLSLADNSSKPGWVGSADIQFAGILRKNSAVTVEADSRDVLVGMDFLRLFGMTLLVTPTAVILVDDEMSVFAEPKVSVVTYQDRPKVKPRRVPSGKRRR